MFWLAIVRIFATRLELLHLGRLSEKEKELEILVLRHQLDILKRRQKAPMN